MSIQDVTYNPVSWTVREMTIGEFRSFSDSINCNPIEQRPDVCTDPNGGSTPSKQQQIIETILLGYDIGEIKIIELVPGEKYQYKSNDGGNRKRAILGYLNRDFPTHRTSAFGKLTFGELPPEWQTRFMNTKIRVVVYDPMPKPQQEGEQFRVTNKVTLVNDQEVLNSYGTIPIASLIRETVRYYEDGMYTPHELFEEKISGKGTVSYQHIGFNNSRLKIEEMIGRIVYMIYKGEKAVVAPYEKVTEMYRDQTLDEKAVDKLAKKLKAVLDFIKKCALAYKSKFKKTITAKQFVMLYRLYFYFKENHGELKVTDYEKFMFVFYETMRKFDPKNPDCLQTTVYKDTVPRMIFEAFNGHLGEHDTQYKMNNMISWFLDEFDLEEATVVTLDKVRIFPRPLVEAKLAEQGYTDWVTGKPLEPKDAVGGHIVPHCDGGKTEYGNLVVISAEHNRRMGSMNAYDYKQMYLESIKETA